MNMRYLMIILCVLMLMGCTVPEVPDDPGITPEPECLIIQEGGRYQSYFRDWQKSQNCPGSPVYPAGTYWVNYDGTMFLIGEPVIFAPSVYGAVPSDCLLIIEPE